MPWPWPTLDGRAPIVIAHRGASGHLPEHTLEGYRRAIELGADFIEPDLVMTADGVLVARHDIWLSDSTDVAQHPEFADRRREVRGRLDWYVRDFTWDEIATLRARQAFPGRSTAWDGRFRIPRFEEIVALVRETGARAGRRVGLYPEVKQRPFFLEAGLDPAARMIEVLREMRFTDPARLFLQAFEPETLLFLKERIDAPLVQLVDAVEVEGGGEGGGRSMRRERAGAAGPPRFRPSVDLARAREYADAVGPSLLLLFAPDGRVGEYVRQAHAAGLRVHPWTMRDDRLPPGVGDPRDWYEMVYATGVDGIFTDFTDTAVSVRAAIRAGGRDRGGE